MKRFHTDDGFTLAEVLVAMVVGSIVLFGIGSLVLGAVRAEHLTRQLSTGSSTTQLIQHTLDTGLQNASALRVDQLPGGKDVLLRARVAEVVLPAQGSVKPQAGFQWRCRGFLYLADQRELWGFWGLLGAAGGADAVPAPGERGWSLISDSIRAVGGDIFRPSGDFGSSVGSVSVSFAAEFGTPGTAVESYSVHSVSRIVMSETEQQQEPERCW